MKLTVENYGRVLAVLFACLLMVVMTGCGGGIGDGSEKLNSGNGQDSPVILCAGFSEYDWARNILGENPGGLSLSLLNDSGIDMHSYQPSVADMAKLSNCDLLIYTGGISEYWINEATENSEDGEFDILSLMDYFMDNPSLFPAYVQDEHDHNHGHEHEHDMDDADEHEHEHEADEHIWLSVKMAPVFCEEIASRISALDPANADYYQENLASYCEKLAALDAEFTDTVANAECDVLLFADRYPFTYLMQDYGIHCHAAFSGCSAETEASFETIIDLAEDLNTDDLSHIVILKGSTDELAQTIIKAAGNKEIGIETLDSLQSVTSDDIDGGLTYIKAMQQNKEVIAECLN